jgi:ribosomal protein S1
VVVQIEVLNVKGKKLVCTMKANNEETAVQELSNVGENKWLEGAVQKVANFGLFIRPAGYDAVG